MKLSEARKLYEKKGPDAVEQDYRNLVLLVRDSKIRDPIPNTDYLHGLWLTDLIFQDSKQHIRMLNGPGKDGWLDVLQKSLDQALTRIRAAKGFLRAIFLADEIPSPMVKLQEKYGTQIVQCKAAFFSDGTRHFRHFITSDRRDLRIENYHPELSPDTDSTEVTADVYFHEPAAAKAMEDYLDELWGYIK